MKKQWLCLGMLLFVMSAAWGQVGVDVTKPGDTIQGVPNNGNWPGSEAPPMAINNDIGSKYLHFNGATQPTGFRVTPSKSQSVVGGMTFTTANDAVERDPMTFELYGSNDSISGPWTFIASGSTYLDVARFTRNTSPIAFTPVGKFDHYQVMFPTCRGPAQNSMQIAEVELLEGVLPLVYGPYPKDKSEMVPANTMISWQTNIPTANPTFTVRFGSDPNHLSSVSNVTATELDPATILGSPLQYDSKYYWNVQVIGDPNIFPTWTFTTAPAVPVVTQDVDDVWSIAGSSAVFHFGAEVVGDPQQVLDFQWYSKLDDSSPAVELEDGVDISGSTTDTLTLTNLEEADVRTYYCIAIGKAGSVESRHAKLQLIELLGHWPLDGDAADISGYGNDGIARGAEFGFEEGIIGQAANFDNLGLFEIPNPSHFDQANGGITVYCWVKTGGTGDWEPFVAKYGENNVGWQLRKRGVSAIHTFTLRGTSGDDDPTPTAPNLFDSKWHQVVGTYDGATRRIYMDGVQIMSFADTGTIATTTAPVSIGGRITEAGGNEAFFNGMVDDVRIYKGPMPAKMVAQMYTEASGVELCSTPLAADVSGPIGLPDCVINIYDLASFASDWMLCTNIDVTRCP